MTVSLQIQETEKFEIALYKAPKDIELLQHTHVPFSGSPRKHPHDSSRIILVSDPYGGGTFYLEFDKKDIAFVEELPNVVDINQDVVPIVRIWVRKGGIGLRCTPFWVEHFNK
jgi:inorganic pyrophosphatase